MIKLLVDKYGEVKSLKRASFDLARAKFDSSNVGKSSTLIEEIEAILDMEGDEPGNADIQFLLGQIYEAIPEKSIEACLAFVIGMLSCDDKEIPVFLNKLNDNLNQKNAAIVYSKIKDELLERITARIGNSKYGKIINSLFGNLFLYIGSYPEAIKYFNEIKDLPANSVDAIEGIGQAYLLSGETKNAIEHFSKAKDIAVSPEKKTEVSLKLIAALIKDKSYEKAIGEIERAKVSTTDIINQLHLNIQLSECYTGTGEFESGLSTINSVVETLESRKIEFNELYIQAILVKAKIHIALYKYSSALKILEEALLIEQRNTELIFLKAQVLFEGQLGIEDGKNLINYLYRKQIDVESKIDQLLEGGPDKGNAFFFSAYIIFLITPQNEKRIDDFIKKADYLGLKIESAYPEKGLYLLKAEIAEKRKNLTDAAANYFETAKRYYWQGNYVEAEKYFRKATELNPTLNEAFKYYAETIYLLSYQADPPYNDIKLIDKAYDTWHRSSEIVKDQYEAWHYIIIARIHEKKYKFREDKSYEEYWQAILYAERALVQNSSDFSLWGYLGIFYRNLNIDINSLRCFEKAEALNSNESFLTEEKVILLLNTGDYQKPLEYLRKLRNNEHKEIIPAGSTGYKPYHKLWEGYIRFHKKKYAEAAALFDETIKEEDTNLFAHQFKMLCHWHSDEFDKAKSEANEIIALGSKYRYLKEEFSFAWAYFIMDEPEKAIATLEQANEKMSIALDNSFSLCQFYLFTGQIERAKSSFTELIKWTYNKRTLLDLKEGLTIIMLMLEKNIPSSNTSVNECLEIAGEWIKKIEDHLETVIIDPPDEWKELTMLQKEYKFQQGTIPFVAIQAGFARLNRNNEKQKEAYHIYKSLVKYGTLFPEAKIALEQIESEILSTAGTHIKDAKYDDAVALLNKFNMRNPGNKCKKNIQLALAYFKIDDKVKSLDSLKIFFRLSKNNSDQNLLWEELTGTTLYNSKLTWQFGYFLRANIQVLGVADIDVLTKKMVENFWTVLMNKANVSYPVVAPITVEISNNLVTPDADSKDWFVIEELIPQMREDIINQYGVKTPGVRIKPNDDLTHSNYTILLEEIPLVIGSVNADCLFVHSAVDELKKLEIEAKPASNPLTGKEGGWVDRKYKETLAAQKIRYWPDVFYYILSHLQAILIDNLDIFIDIHFCNDYLFNYSDGKNDNIPKELAASAKNIMSNGSLLILFKQVLRGLIKEKAPILSKEIIIRSFIDATHTCAEVNDLIKTIRTGLKKELPGNTVELPTIVLPSSLEESIKKELRTEDGKTFLAMIPENCQKVLAEIRNIIERDSPQGKIMLVTKDSQLRIHLRKLVELKFPHLIVMSEEELIGK